ncbi:MAG: hypothetical protein Q8O22_04455 [Candidatus Omnitrophota bacterium]|nr:hypothetical protein [Candidatus Omnitrophota bacterium]
MLKKIINILKILLIFYILFIVNGCLVVFVYTKINPSYAITKVAFPFGSLAVLLAVMEMLVYRKYKKKK